MDFGIAMATAADSWKIVERAEALGFSHAWFYDTQMPVSYTHLTLPTKA